MPCHRVPVDHPHKLQGTTALYNKFILYFCKFSAVTGVNMLKILAPVHIFDKDNRPVGQIEGKEGKRNRQLRNLFNLRKRTSNAHVCLFDDIIHLQNIQYTFYPFLQMQILPFLPTFSCQNGCRPWWRWTRGCRQIRRSCRQASRCLRGRHRTPGVHSVSPENIWVW